IPPKDHPLLVQNILKFLWFVISLSNKICQYRLKSFGCPASEHKYTINESKQITAVDYFRDKLNICLCNPHLPVVEVYNSNDENQSYFLPIELVNVDKGQTNLQSLTPAQHAKIEKKTVVSPEERYKMIRHIVNERGFNQDLYLKEFDITVNADEMIMLPARILPRPKIKYKSSHGDLDGNVIERVQIGKWCLNNCFVKTYEIRTWAVVFVSPHEPNDHQIGLVRKIAQKLPEAMLEYGIRFNPSSIEKTIAAEEEKILVHTIELRKRKCEIIFYILHQAGYCIYYMIKCFEYWKKLGIVIRCIDFKHLESNNTSSKMNQYVRNLFGIFNTTADGVNQFVSSIQSLTSPLVQRDIFMFFGIVCTNIKCSRERPPIVTIIGSKDSTGTKYADCVQFSSQEKIPLEFINDLHIYVRDLLCEFSNYNSYLPNKLILYRAGVDDGSFEKILDNELSAIRQACQELYGHNPLPKICFIVVKNDHNTRTVIDTDIVLRNGFDFYLNSHTTIQGTSQPTFYQVLYDDIGFTSDDIQQLTYYLCHTDVRCTNVIPVPAPIHYATRCVTSDENNSNTTNDSNFGIEEPALVCVLDVWDNNLKYFH
ncbi:unnamed protein product, partial [Rotaria sp. Silwood1]